MPTQSGLAYYNEIDRHAAAWLRELIAANAIAPGFVDERDLRDVTPAELLQYTQCHFFAGIGVWSHALRLAGWPDTKPVWTGSCPCQPFSTAGKGGGFADERHLWPHWHHLIRTARPAIVFGEQVASKDGLGWLDLVQDDLEGENYTCRPIDCCAAGVGAPHIRQRLWFVADANRKRLQERCASSSVRSCRSRRADVLADTDSECGLRREEQSGFAHPGKRTASRMADRNLRRCSARELGDHQGERRQELRPESRQEQSGHSDSPGEAGRAGPTNGHWSNADWLRCRDGRWRPVEPGSFPLVDGLAGRVGLLRGYGNAINAEVAAAVIRAAMPDLP